MGKIYVNRKVKKPLLKSKKSKKTVSVKALNNKINALEKSIKKNTEMKWCELASPLNTITGQVAINNAGYGFFELTSSLFSFGAGVNANSGRIGDKINLKGLFLRIQLQQQSALAIGVSYKFVIFKTDDIDTTGANMGLLCYNADAMSGVVDYNSCRNNVYRKVYQLIRQFNVYIPSDNIASTNLFRDKKFFLKCNDILEYASASSNPPQNVRYFMFCFPSAGNNNGASASTLPNIPLIAVNTGTVVNISITGYYTDN